MEQTTILTKPIALSRFATAQFLIGALLLLCALTFYYFAVLRIDYSKTTLLDLAPYPDATEYFAQAKALYRDRWPSIQIGYEKLPSKYPFGYPVLMLPWLKILPEADGVLAPFRTSQTMGLLLILAVFVFYAYLAMPLTGGFAVLLLTTLPGFFTFCRASMSEVSASLLIVLAFMFAYLGVKEERRWKIYLSAVFLGLSLNIRIQSLFFAPLLLAMALIPMRGVGHCRWFLHCAAMPVVLMVAVSPTLMLNTIQFHSPLKTGYDLWEPYFSQNHLRFRLRYISTIVATLWRELTVQPRGYYAANIFGTGTCFVPAFVGLACTGLLFIRLTWFVRCAFLAGLSSFTALLCYWAGRDGRFYLPLLILLIAIAVLPVTWAANNVRVTKRMIPAAAVFILFTAACLGYPSRSGYNTQAVDRSQAWDALHFTTSPALSVDFVAQKHFAKVVRQPGIVLSYIDPVYLNALLPTSFVAAPIDGEHHYKWSYSWRYDQPQALALVKHGLQQSLPVYALFVSREDATTKQSRLPNVAGYKWRVLNNSDDNTTILELTAIGPDQTTPIP